MLSLAAGLHETMQRGSAVSTDGDWSRNIVTLHSRNDALNDLRTGRSKPISSQ